MTVSRAGTGQPVPGVIDTIGTAYALLNRRPYLILVLVALDVVYWLGPRLSPESFFGAVADWLASVGADQQALNLVRDSGAQFGNVAPLLSILVPTLAFTLGAGAFPTVPGASPVVDLPWWLVPFAAPTLACAGVVLGMGYLTMLARLLRGQPVLDRQLPRAIAVNGGRMIAFYLMLVGLALLVLLPVSFTAAFGLLIGIGGFVLPMVSLFVFVLSLWAFLLTFFVEEAIVLSQAGPLRALFLSYQVLRSHFWQVLRFILVVLLIQIGSPVVLSLFLRTPWGVPFASVSFAYLVTGLTLAALIFYRDRLSSALTDQAVKHSRS